MVWAFFLEHSLKVGDIMKLPGVKGDENLLQTKSIVTASLIASIYCVLVLAFAPISYGAVQVRIAEALTLLPYLWVEAIPGLFIGCLLANILGGFGLIDIVFGSLATLIAAIWTRKMPNLFLAALPPVLVNMIIVGAYLSRILDMSFMMVAIYIGIGQSIACYGLGIPLVYLIRRQKIKKRMGS